MKAVLAGIAAHAAILLVPWSLTGEPLAFAALVVWVLGTAFEGAGASPMGPVPAVERVRALAVLAAVAVSLATATGGFWAALGLVAVGLALRVWAARTLGAGFGVGLTPTVPWVHHGPYRWLRHPSELGLVVAVAGIALACGSVPGGVLTAVGVALPSALRAAAESPAPLPEA